MRISLLAALLIAACGTSQPRSAPGPASTTTATTATPEPKGPESSDILAREADANEASVQHILISWRDLAGSYPGGAMHPRARDRSASDAEALVVELLGRARAGEPFEALMLEYSEDEASARGGDAITVTPDASLVLDFKRLSLRLKVGEIGVARTPYGWHIIKRVS